MIGQFEGLCTQFAFQCALFQINWVTSVYSGEHCGYWCTLGVGSIGCGTITELVWIFLRFGLCL